VWMMVESRRTVFDLGKSLWPVRFVELIRGGRPPLDVPISFPGGRFDGPFVSKSRTGGRVDAFVVKLPAWTVGATAAPVTIRLIPKRHMK
uniref:hypothetical protein n=1 Tax=Salmonella sp. SAL4435 TaxID=3159890 RepID=UPI00397DC3D4